MNFERFLKSFLYALMGIKKALQNQQNIRIHFAAAILVIILGFVVQVSALEWVCLIFAIGLVMATEMINTSIEGLADLYTREDNPQVKLIKDIAAGAVLIAAITAAVVGLIIFLPKI